MEIDNKDIAENGAHRGFATPSSNPLTTPQSLAGNGAQGRRGARAQSYPSTLSILPAGSGTLPSTMGLGLESPLFLPIVPVEPSPTTGIQHLIPPLFHSNASASHEQSVRQEARPQEVAMPQEPPPEECTASVHPAQPAPQSYRVAVMTTKPGACAARCFPAGRCSDTRRRAVGGDGLDVTSQTHLRDTYCHGDFGLDGSSQMCIWDCKSGNFLAAGYLGH